MNTTPSSTPHISSTTTSDGIAVEGTPGHGNWPRSNQQVDAIRSAGASDKRALVLAGAGAAGNAWEIGLIAGLSNAGVDATEADLIIGTSAGSTVAAQITSGTRPAELFAAILAEVPRSRTGAVGSDRGRAPNWSGANYMEWSNGIIDAAEDAADMRRRMGAAALEMDAASDSSAQTQWRATVAARLLSHHWPQRPVLITAVDARTGEPVVFDRHSGIDLVRRRRRQHHQWLRPLPSLPHRRQPIHQRRLPTQRERRPGSRIRAGAGAVTIRRQITDAAGLGHGSRNPGRRTARRWQQSRDCFPGSRLRRRIRRQCSGSVDASAGRARRLRPRQSPCRAAHRILALTP